MRGIGGRIISVLRALCPQVFCFWGTGLRMAGELRCEKRFRVVSSFKFPVYLPYSTCGQLYQIPLRGNCQRGMNPDRIITSKK